MSNSFDPSKSENHYRTELNNFLQVNGGPDRLKWEKVEKGPPHKPTWIAICYIDGVEYGKGDANTLAEAKERAAHVAHRALLFDRFRRSAGGVLVA